MFLFDIVDLVKTYETEKKRFNAVDHVSLSLPCTGLVCIVGKSGCGKSTLLNLLMGIEKKTSGTIFYLGKDMSKMKEKQLSKYHLEEVSMVYQHYNLMPDFNVLENVILPLRIAGYSKRKARKIGLQLLDKFHLKDREKQKTSKLSGGEKQRVAIARALSTNPRVILCDEPTGALDHKNSCEVMDELKRVSKKRLVVMVSHDLKLVQEYASRIIQMSDGHIELIEEQQHCSYKTSVETAESTYKEGWLKNFIKSILRKNIFKHIISFISCAFGFSSILIGIGFINGSQSSQDEALTNNLELGVATVSETSYFELKNSPLKFKKNIRPNVTLVDEYLDAFSSTHIEANTSYFFPLYQSGEFNGNKTENFQVIPLLREFVDNSQFKPKIDGEIDSFSLNSVIVNQEFLDLLNISEKSLENRSFLLSYQTQTSYRTNDPEKPFIIDDYSHKISMNIMGVIHEFSFMNSPKIYVCYESLCEMLETKTLENLSHYRDENVSVLDYINDCNPDDPESSYSSYLFLDSISERDKLFNLISKIEDEEDIFQIESNVFNVFTAYQTFITSFQDALIYFLGIAFVGVLFILGMISLASFLQRKKESAILTCLGSKSKSIRTIYLLTNLFITYFSLACSIGISIIAKSIINTGIYKSFGLQNLIAIPLQNFIGIPYGLPLMLFLLATISSVLFTIVPIQIYKNFSVANELRDE